MGNTFQTLLSGRFQRQRREGHQISLVVIRQAQDLADDGTFPPGPPCHQRRRENSGTGRTIPVHGELQKQLTMAVGLANPVDQRLPAGIMGRIGLIDPIPGEIPQTDIGDPPASRRHQRQERHITDDSRNLCLLKKTLLLHEQSVLMGLELLQPFQGGFQVKAQAVFLHQADIQTLSPVDRADAQILPYQETGNIRYDDNFEAGVQLRQSADHLQRPDRVAESMGSNVIGDPACHRVHPYFILLLRTTLSGALGPWCDSVAPKTLA
jgi:hypothetical protein